MAAKIKRSLNHLRNGKTAPKVKIKRNDKVVVIAGKSKGHTGRVLRVIADKQRVLVEGAQLVKKHIKPNPQQNIKGGISEQEATLHISNVMLVDSEGKRTRIGFQGEGTTKQRVARSNGVTIAEKKPATAKKK